MRRILLSLLLSILALLPLNAAPLSIWGIGSRATFKVVYPYTDEETGRVGETGGTAFCVPGTIDRVMTAAHVVEGAPREVPMVDSRTFESHKAQVMKVDQKRDVAILRILEDEKPCDLAPSTWAPEVPSPGAHVWAFGYGGMKVTPLLVEGIVAGLRGIEDDQPNGVPAQLGVLGGHSGSPVYDDQGRIVGMVDGFFKAYDIMDVIIPVEELRKVLR